MPVNFQLNHENPSLVSLLLRTLSLLPQLGAHDIGAAQFYTEFIPRGPPITADLFSSYKFRLNGYGISKDLTLHSKSVILAKNSLPSLD
jgi:hypothetical protein